MKIILIVILLGSIQVLAAELEVLDFEPANFKNSKISFQNRIKYPKSELKKAEDGTIILRCDAVISKRGKFAKNFCFDYGSDKRKFDFSVSLAAKKSTLKAARVNGAARKVSFQYFVAFHKKGQDSLVEVFPNAGLYIEQYGADYTSAQRYKEGRGNFGAKCSRGQFTTVKAFVNKLGTVTKVEVEGENIGKGCRKYLIKAFSQHKFIPAFVKGEPVDSWVKEDIFNAPRLSN